ncbi:MAG: hypothetical protein KAJ62_06805 [Desulfobacteraceae bacterium]|nr:hypothetical protein [Desulfobacteraceae bacterium]
MNISTKGTIGFSSSLIHGTINFLGSDIEQLLFIDTKLTGRVFISSRELKLSNKLISKNDVINQQDKTTHKDKAYQFRFLKENFRNLGQYNDEDNAYIQFRRNELLASKEESNQFVYYFKKIFFERIGHFGTNPLSIAFTMFLTVALFTFIYFLPFYFSVFIVKNNFNNVDILNNAAILE